MLILIQFEIYPLTQLIPQRDNIHAKTPYMCVDPRGWRQEGLIRS